MHGTVIAHKKSRNFIFRLKLGTLEVSAVERDCLVVIHGWRVNIKVDLKEIHSENLDLVQLAEIKINFENLDLFQLAEIDSNSRLLRTL
jgi:hypothetical protein